MAEAQPTLNRVLALLLLGCAFYFRASGLFHGLNDGVVFHPDTPKQVDKISDYLQNTTVRYRNDWNYDGYPYGLNRVDEVLVRGVYLFLRPAHRLLWGDGTPLDFPSRSQLYLWARAFRVLYALLMISITALAVRTLTRSTGAGIATLALLAVAPLAATVTHSAAGDIGVDLFLSVSLLCTALSARRGNPLWLPGAGLAAGMAFACKYQGGLALWIPAVYACLRGKPGWNALPRLLRDGLLTAAGFVAGAIALTPAFLLDPRTTWRQARAFVREVKVYRVDPEFLELPLWRQLAHGLTHNLPGVVVALGWMLAAVCIVSFLAALRVRFTRREDGMDAPRAAAWIAVASFPLMALPLSTALKANVQLFHFSFLLPPLAAAAGLLFSRAFLRKNPLPRLGVLVVLALILANDTTRSLREDWFWRRRDLVATRRAYTRGVSEVPLQTVRNFNLPGGIKRFYLEPARLPVFRNAPGLVVHPEADWWNEHRQLPVPAVPLLEDPAWILLNGAIHPRSDRQVLLPAGQPVTFRIVAESSPPSPIRIGFRSGTAPARVSGTLAGEEVTLNLAPHDQRVLDLPLAVREKRVPAHGPHPETHVYRVDLVAGPGDVWATVLEDADAETLYARFGPDPDPAPQPDPGETARRLLQAARYLEFDRLHPRANAPHSLTDRPLALAAGRYTLTLQILNPGEKKDTLEVALTDNAGLAPKLSSGPLRVDPGFQEITWTFEKPFLPHQVHTEVRMSTGLRFERASLKPEFTERRPSDVPTAPLSFTPFEIAYDNGVRLTGFHAPEPPRAGQPFTHALRAEAWEASPRVMAETLVFLHLVDARGNLVKALDFPLIAASFGENRPNPRGVRMPDDLPEGPLYLDLGLHTPRTRLRETPRVTDAPDLEGKPARRAVRVKRFDP